MTGNSRILLASLLGAIMSDAFARQHSGDVLIIDDKTKGMDKKDLDDINSCIPVFPRTKEEKLAAMGLSVNSPDKAKSIKRGDGIKPISNALNPNSRECKRRLRQMQRRKALAQQESSPEDTVVTATETAVTSVPA